MIISELTGLHKDNPTPFIIKGEEEIYYSDILSFIEDLDLAEIRQGDVVALVGDFDPPSIGMLLALFDRKAIVVPLTESTRGQHDYFFEAASVDFVIDGGKVRRIRDERASHPFLQELRIAQNPGLVLFSSGTTGRPKAILHDFSSFLVRYRTLRPSLKTLNFLLFDHIGGINTLLHTLYNKGQVVVPTTRDPNSVFADIDRFQIELLPTTPTFLRMALLGETLDRFALKSLKLITYGTERMDQPTLNRLCERLPWVDFRQTFGMSELGILRVKSEARDSLWMRVGGEGVSLEVRDQVLWIKSDFRMIGYLNAPSPFVDGWYNTRDLVEERDGLIKVVGRTSEVINVGGVKILPSEIERVALLLPGVLRCRAVGVENPITGQHIELTCQPQQGASLSRRELKKHFVEHLPMELVPHKFVIDEVAISHRFKQM